MIEEVGAPDAMEVPWPEEQTVSSSSGESPSSGHVRAMDMHEEGSNAVDTSEASRRYVFGPSTVTIDRIRKMSSLHFFTEGDVQEPEEEVIPQPSDDEAMVFEEFFIARLQMPPQPALVDIIHKFRV
jgi:hypothetical protein